VSWGSIRGHDRVVADLRQTIALGRLPHALLFVGPEGIGKRTLAKRFCQALFCETRPESLLDPCEACAGCLQVAAATHPDFIEARRPADKHELPISVIRAVCDEFGLKPARGVRKVAIIDDADDLNEEASNAFLKTLEEPPPGAVLILIGTSAELQLPTIVSRCQVIRFDPLPEPELAALLLARGVAKDEDHAARIAALGEGSMARALGLADVGLASFRRALLDEISADAGFDPGDLASRLQAFVKAGGKESVDQRRRASLMLGELARFFRVVLWQTIGSDPPCADESDRRAAGALAVRLHPEAVVAAAERCLEASYHVQRRLYMPLILASLMRDLGRLIKIAR
jgi:DNA polymerase-3 subunit delta'